MTPLRSFVREHLGDVEVLDRPRPGGTTRVARVRDGAGREWFAKRLLVAERFRAEVGAYRLWSHLDGVASPRATCEDRRCLLLPAVPGAHPSGQSPRVLRAAGRTIRQMHETPVPSGWSSRWRDVAETRVGRLLEDLPRRGVRVDAGLVRSHLARLLAVDVDEVPTHGDYQPHNWLWRRGRLHVLDLESAALRPAAFDLARLRFAACWQRPELFGSVLDGYGRRLSAAEERFVVSVLPWRALVAIDLGLRAERREMVLHGRRVLEELGRDRLRLV